MTGARHAGTHRATSATPALRLVGGLLTVSGVAVLVWLALKGSPPLDSPPQAGAPLSASPTPTTAPLSPSPSSTPRPRPTTGAPLPTAASTATAAPAPAQTAPLLPLLVLNNSRINGLAADAAADFRAGGWTVRGTGNFRGRVAMTTVYYEPGQEATARRLMREFGKIRRMSPRFDGLPGSGLTVVVTRDYSAP